MSYLVQDYMVNNTVQKSTLVPVGNEVNGNDIQGDFDLVLALHGFQGQCSAETFANDILAGM